MKYLKNYFCTFKKKRIHSPYDDKYVIIKATSYDRAKKKMIDTFGYEWENIYTQIEWNGEYPKKRLPKNEYKLIRNIEKFMERKGRITFGIYKEKDK